MLFDDVFEETATFTMSYVRLEDVKELVQGKEAVNLAFLFSFYIFVYF